jgi:hypothetical protein
VPAAVRTERARKQRNGAPNCPALAVSYIFLTRSVAESPPSDDTTSASGVHPLGDSGAWRAGPPPSAPLILCSALLSKGPAAPGLSDNPTFVAARHLTQSPFLQLTASVHSGRPPPIRRTISFGGESDLRRPGCRSPVRCAARRPAPITLPGGGRRRRITRGAESEATRRTPAREVRGGGVASPLPTAMPSAAVDALVLLAGALCVPHSRGFASNRRGLIRQDPGESSGRGKAAVDGAGRSATTHAGNQIANFG